VAEFRRAIELDPLSPQFLTDLCFPLSLQGNYEASNEQSRKALELDPSYYWGHATLGFTDLYAGRDKDAIPKLEKALTENPTPHILGWLGYAYAVAGERAKARATIVELNKMSSHQFVSPFSTAIVYVGLGDKERALDGLEKAYEARSQWMVLLKVAHAFDPIRSDPRYIALLKKVGLDK
jgi:tetratricopeptide (TPR) repeat protein